jgi:hypothetical protein
MEPLGERHRFRRQTGRPRRHLATAESGPRPTPRDLRAASPLTEVHRPRARQAVDVVGAPAYDPNRSFALAPSCKCQSHNFMAIVTYSRFDLYVVMNGRRDWHDLE